MYFDDIWADDHFGFDLTSIHSLLTKIYEQLFTFSFLVTLTFDL